MQFQLLYDGHHFAQTSFWSCVLYTLSFAKAKDEEICFGPDQYFIQAYLSIPSKLTQTFKTV